MHREMREDARRDAVTGVGSRLRLDEDLAALCARVARYGHAYCVALIGVEPADDETLRRVGAALGEQIRSGDVLYRSGPAQFAVLLPEQGLDTANLAAERLREAALRGAGADGGQRRDRHHRHRAGAGGAAGARRGGAGARRRVRRDRRPRRRRTRARCGCWSPTTTPCHG